MPQVPSSLPDPTLLQELCTVALQPEVADYLPFGMRARVQAYLRSSTANGWQPIDAAPQDGTIVNVWLGDADDEDVAFYCLPGTRISCGWSWQQGRLRPSMGLSLPVVTVRPSHWMALPKGPTT